MRYVRSICSQTEGIKHTGHDPNESLLKILLDMDSTTIFKTAALLVASWCCNRTCTSPNPPADESEQKKYTKEYKRTDTMAVSIKTTCRVYEVSLSPSL